MNKTLSSFIFCIIAGILSFFLCFLCLQIISMIDRSTNFEASSSGYIDEEGFPEVDWEYWQSINEDIIGWITIPNTAVSYPIVQAPADNPTYYLSYDIYKEWNPLGAIYLDADAIEQDFNSQNAVIFGHSMINASVDETRMFSSLIQYTKQEFADVHPNVLVQTPEKKMKLKVFAVDNIGGWQNSKYTSFANNLDFQNYISEAISSSVVSLTNTVPKADKIVTLCTCSYNFAPSNERTLVFLYEP